MATSLKTTLTADVSGIALRAPAVPASFISPCTDLLTNVKKGRSAGSANATTVGYIEDVIQADTGVELSTQNDGGDETRTIAIDNEAISLNIIGTAGETLAARDMVYLKESDGKWYKQDSNASNPVAMGRFRGCAPAAITINTTGTIRIKGKVTGFTGLSAGGKVWASTTAGSYTQTKPFATVGGTQIALSEMGYAYSSSVVWIEPKSLRYLKRATLADDDTMTVEHHADDASYGRNVSLIQKSSGSVITEYDETHWDGHYPLNGPDASTGGSNSHSSSGTTRVIGGSEDARVSQRFGSVGEIGILRTFTVNLGANSGSPSGTMTWEIQTDNAGDPSGTIITSGTFTPVASSSNVLVIPDGPHVTGATIHHLVLRSSDPQSAGVYWNWNSSSGGTGSFDSTVSYLCTSSNGGTSWTQVTTDDMSFAFDIIFSNEASLLAQSFQIGSPDEVSNVRLYMKKVGSPSGNLTVGIYSNALGDPNNLLATSDAISASILNSTFDWVDFEFSSPVALSASTTYWIVLGTSTVSASDTDYVSLAIDFGGGYASGQMKESSSGGSTWDVNVSADAIFQIQGESFYTIGKLVYWGADNAFENRLDDGAGSNADTKTTVKNTTGSEATVTAEVAFERT